MSDLDPLELAALRLAVDEQPPEELPGLAADALVRGLDSPSLREAAGTRDDEVRDAHDRFVAALDELGIEIPEVDDALWRLVRAVAAQIVSGGIAPYEGASWIWHHASHRVEREGDLRIFIGLASEWEDHPDYRTEYEQRIVEEAEILLRCAEPRRWVKLMARMNAWPLWQANPPRNLSVTDIPMTDALRADIRVWAADFDDAATSRNSGPSGFASQAEAQAFVERGRDIVSRLQDELGDDWHVEYMPTPTAFPPG